MSITQRDPSLSKMLRLMAVCAIVGGFAGNRSSADEIPERTVRAYMEFLASDALDGRGSGTRDEWITATYLASQMHAYGLEPMGDDGGFVQTVGVRRSEVVGAPVLTVGTKRYAHGAQMIVLDLDATNVDGALQAYRPGVNVIPGAAYLMPEGANPGDADVMKSAGMILWQETPRLHALWDSLRSRQLTVGPTRLVGVPQPPVGPASPLQILLNADSYRELHGLPENTRLQFTAESRDTLSHTWNAVGRLPGSDPQQRDQVILLTAHLDHLGEKGPGPDRIYNGADDDASGTIAVLTLAQALAAGPRPKRSIVFALFGSEEVGSIGARYFLARPTLPLESITTNLEFEMVGRSDAAVAEHTLWLTGWERTNLGPELARHGARLVADPHPNEHFFTRSDNFTLARRGIVAQTISSYGLHAQYHQPSDDISHIDFQHMTGSINSMLLPIRWLANSGFMPAWLPGGRP